MGLGALPDPGCTPGAAMDISVDEVCTTPTARLRHVTSEMKRQVFVAYGLAFPQAARRFQVDHLIPLELGGSNDIANLWPEPRGQTAGYHQKDLVENELHRRVCKEKSMTLSEAQRIIATDWLRFYNEEVGK